MQPACTSSQWIACHFRTHGGFSLPATYQNMISITPILYSVIASTLHCQGTSLMQGSCCTYSSKKYFPCSSESQCLVKFLLYFVKLIFAFLFRFWSGGYGINVYPSCVFIVCGQETRCELSTAYIKFYFQIEFNLNNEFDISGLFQERNHKVS